MLCGMKSNQFAFMAYEQTYALYHVSSNTGNFIITVHNYTQKGLQIEIAIFNTQV